MIRSDMPTIWEIGNTQYWLSAEEQIPVREHDAFRRSRGAGCVDQDRDVLRTIGLNSLCSSILIKH